MKEALKLALEALIGDRAFLERDAPVEIWGVNDKAITAIKAALAQEQEPWCMKINGCKTKCEDCPVEVVEQEPVAWVTKRNVIVDGLWEEEITFSEFDDGGDPVYYTSPQRTEERNFCQRCGKRTADLTVIHTCTPPQENT